MSNDYDTMTAITDTCLTGGKWYWEVRTTSVSGMLCLGVVRVGFNIRDAYCLGADATGNSWGIQGPNSCLYHRGMTNYKNVNWFLSFLFVFLSSLSLNPLVTNRDSSSVIGVALDLDNRKLMFYLNGEKRDLEFNNVDPGQGVHPAVCGNGTITGKFNFGARKFKYPIPDGFLPIECEAAPGTVCVRVLFF